MGRTSSTNERDDKCVKILVRKNERKRPPEDAGVDGRIILKLMLGKHG
jgi:hypothetical protein